PTLASRVTNESAPAPFLPPVTTPGAPAPSPPTASVLAPPCTLPTPGRIVHFFAPLTRPVISSRPLGLDISIPIRGSVAALKPVCAPPSLSVSVMTSLPEPSLTLFHAPSTVANFVCSISSPFWPTLASAGLVPSGTTQYSPKSVFLWVPTGLG